MKIEYSSNFERDLGDVKDKKLRARIAMKIRAIESAGTLREIAGVEKLDGYKDAYRIRIGSYRLGFPLDGELIILGRFLHRKDIYNKFP